MTTCSCVRVDDLLVRGGIHPSDGIAIVEEKLDTVPARVTSVIDTSCQPNANLRYAEPSAEV